MRQAFLTIALLLAIVVAAASTLLWSQEILIGKQTPDAAAEAPGRADFANASDDRIFLSAAESREAARRGLVPAGTRSILSTRGPLDFGEWRWDEVAVPPGPIAVRVDLERQLVSVFRGANEIGTAVIVYGAEGKETPRGKLPIRGKTRAYHSVTYDAPMPYSLWLREDGVALHGSSVAMGRATNGCIGVPVEFAEKLFAAASVGDVVEVIG